jgi:hypothetical protein
MRGLMDDLDYWRLCDEYTIVQAALLIVGEDPSGYQELVYRKPQDWPTGYEATITALSNAIEGKRLGARIVTEDDGALNRYATKIGVEDLRDWLRSRGITTGFFFPRPAVGPDYLSRLHPNYSPKLAAAVEAWRAVSADEELRRGKSVKQALAIWLRQHANEFGLTKEDGNPNEQGIEEIAKIANWDTKGGAPKTPGNP